MEEYDKQVNLEHAHLFKSSVLRSPRLHLFDQKSSNYYK